MMVIIEGNFGQKTQNLNGFYMDLMQLIEDLPPETPVVAIIGILEIAKQTLFEHINTSDEE